jgi:glycosyltransferase involved in cell wall biosynthesis
LEQKRVSGSVQVVEKPLVSVLIPTRNRCRRLFTTLRSVVAQREVNLEIVVVDDGSEDDTDKMVIGLGDPRIRLVRNESPRGESGARNRGLEETRGAWVAFLDDDDLWAPDKLARQLRALQDTRREWAYTGDVMVNSELRLLSGGPPPPPEELIELLRRYNSVPAGASNVIVSSRLVAQVGPFDPGLKRTADWDMWLRLAREGPAAWVRSPLVANCIHAANMSKDMTLMFQELDVLARRHGIPVDWARHYRWAAWGALADGRRLEALRYYGGAIAAGDLRSVGRATIALVRPLGAGTRRESTDAWTAEARGWVDELR